MDAWDITNNWKFVNSKGGEVDNMLICCVFNMVKYLIRAGLKDGESDTKDITKVLNYAKGCSERYNWNDDTYLVYATNGYTLLDIIKSKDNINKEVKKQMILMNIMECNFTTVEKLCRDYILGCTNSTK